MSRTFLIFIFIIFYANSSYGEQGDDNFINISPVDEEALFRYKQGCISNLKNIRQEKIFTPKEENLFCECQFILLGLYLDTHDIFFSKKDYINEKDLGKFSSMNRQYCMILIKRVRFQSGGPLF